MSGDVQIYLRSIVPFLTEKVAGWFGHDERSNHIREMVKERLDRSIAVSQMILIAGMSKQMSLLDSYQILRLARCARAQWDRERGVLREAPEDIHIDGRDLFACLKRIAAGFERLDGSTVAAITKVREHLLLMQNEKADPKQLLYEMARWFAFLIPTDLNGGVSFIAQSTNI